MIKLSFQKDRESILQYVFDNFSVLDEDIIDKLVCDVEKLKYRNVDYNDEGEKMKDFKKLRKAFVKEKVSLTCEKSKNCESGLPKNISRIIKPTYTRNRVQFTHNGLKPKGLVEVHKTLSSAEHEVCRVKLMLLDEVLNNYLDSGVVYESDIDEINSEKNFLKGKIEMLLSGSF